MDYPKFIISKTGYLRLGMVHQHKDLLQDGDICYGGGFYEFDYASNRIILHGASFDFGRPKWLDMETLHISSAYRGWTIIYRYEDGEIFDILKYLKTDYY